MRGDGDKDDGTEHDLECQREASRHRARGEAEAEVDPTTERDAEGDERTFDHGHLPMPVRLQGFGLPGRYLSRG